MKKIILIDNYDSFTFNLYHYLSSLKVKVDVIRNDQITSNEILKRKYNKIVISPGPGNPNQSGNCLKIVKSLYKKIPILGVCLGHQIIGQVFGSKIVQAKRLMHGKTSKIITKKLGILKNLPKSFEATRYHSLIDTCGTGGDGMNTLNISTASALLLASMNVKVAKHGNKAVSSKCGSGDVLEALKIKINLEPKEIEDQINKNNFGFMFAPNYHSAMRFVGPTRKKIGKRTIFNMIGPLSSPALVKRQVVGVFDKKLLRIFANALNNLDIKFAWIVNSEDGLDEISPYAKTNVIQLKDKKISEIVIDPKELKINADKFENLVGDDAKFNAEKMINIFKGEDNDFSKAVCLNAAAGLIVNENHKEFTEAYKDAREHILSNKVIEHLETIQNA